MIEVTYIDHMGTDLSIVNAARVSFGKNSKWDYIDWRDTGDYARKKILSEGDTKLIKYLAKHKHTSPFGHAFASFHVKAPIFVARQLVKHKFLRWNEISRRYVDSEPEFYVPDEWRGRSEDKKQGSDGVVEVGKIGDISLTSKVLYNSLLDRGVCPEQARMVLPQSTMTEWYWSGSLDAFADMCNLRLETDTQYETQLVAQQIDQIMLGLFPVSWEALVYGEDE
jgi:thymidylate synthase (FAD)